MVSEGDVPKFGLTSLGLNWRDAAIIAGDVFRSHPLVCSVEQWLLFTVNCSRQIVLLKLYCAQTQWNALQVELNQCSFTPGSAAYQ